MKKIFVIFLILSFINIYGVESDGEFRVILSPNTKNPQTKFLDINTSSKEEMLAKGISLSYVNKIIEYREITGGFSSLKEMVRISGIGDKTQEKLAKYFSKPSEFKRKELYINDADDTTLKYFGFTKNEIKNIENYRLKNSKIRSNLELKNILSATKYDKYKDIIKYEKID